MFIPSRVKNFNFPRWLPVAASVMLMGMVAFVAVVNMTVLRRANDWRKHTAQVTLAAHAYEDNLVDIQRDLHGFVTMGDMGALAACQHYIRLEPQLFDQLVRLVQDSPEQEQRLDNLGEAMKNVFADDARMIDAYKQQGAEVVLHMEQTGEGRIITDRAIDILKEFSAEEQKLLDARDAAEQADYQNAELLLIVGSALAAALLLFASVLASREISRRHRSEAKQRELIAELKQTLAQVKTLSGLIPICAWCKNVRNDKGYWSTVETYVHSRTDASFSHSICPSCTEKFKDEIARANARPQMPPPEV